VLTGSTGFFVKGLALGFGSAAVLFYFVHMETITSMQTDWLAKQQELAQQNLAATRKASQQQQIETIDLLMKSYAISDGNEDVDMRSVLIQSGHIQLLQQVQQQSNIDVSDLIQQSKPFNSAQLYAALLRMKQAQEKTLARQLLDQRLPQNPSAVAKTD
jgi:hypothetical protein